VVSHENASAHNLVLDSLISTGVFGTVFFLAALWKTGTSIWALLDGKRGAAGVALAMMTIVVSVMAMTSGSIGQSPEFWIFSSLVIVVAASDARPKPSRLPARNRG
jgi:O-antigen ligase